MNNQSTQFQRHKVLREKHEVSHRPISVQLKLQWPMDTMRVLMERLAYESVRSLVRAAVRGRFEGGVAAKSAGVGVGSCPVQGAKVYLIICGGKGSKVVKGSGTVVDRGEVSDVGDMMRRW